MTYLAENSADINALSHCEGTKSTTALKKPAMKESFDMVYLVKHDANVNAAPAGEEGLATLQFAAKDGVFIISEFLIDTALI